MPGIITIPGALKAIGLPENICFDGSVADLLKVLIKYIGVEIPETITNVIVSNQQPSDSQRTSVWFRTSNSGGFLGIYVYAAGSWQLVTAASTGSAIDIIWKYGDSRFIPQGYKLVDDQNAKLTTSDATEIMQQYIPRPSTTPAFYRYFAVTFEGF